MRFFILVWCGWIPMAWAAEPAIPVRLMSQTVQMPNTGRGDVALVCPRKGAAMAKAPTPAAEPSEIPGDDAVNEALQSATNNATANLPAKPFIHQPLLTRPHGWRLAIWGDSHMAAAFFSDQLARKLVPVDTLVSSRFVQSGVGHGGVRGLVRKTCLSGEWGREMAYAHADAAAAPGPGMTSLVAKGSGATLAMDLRDAQGQPRHNSLQLLYHGEGLGSTLLAIRVDDETETEVSLDNRAGPHALVLQTSQALATLQIRVVSGQFRFQGIKLPEAPTPPPLHLDLFAYPGATVGGWARSDLAYLASWFTDQPYDLALIAFGTNEGNDPRFNETTYRETLNKALGNFRQVFPQTQCLLIGPGDRGIRVVKSKTTKSSKNSPRKGAKPPSKGAQNTPSTRSGPSAPAAPLLKYSRIHAHIGHIQTELAAQHGCLAWSMQEAMGGVGSAYAWARKNPPLMAPDLIHFTPAGYRELANRFMADFGLASP
ncbi:hypothetical protein [Limnohabitans sp. G3-2]|uniref:hypothetical protein n=1 Tax=Limnohabitans sp. G3-2 TaxID=1100711 RepID=UPI000C1F51A7|nr:hypothetical protein [Limnohabitans sp. G3-2]PIT73276.1 hypothetical protein B9Z31_11005 [Limnohabitans sp. G3-2]